MKKLFLLSFLYFIVSNTIFAAEVNLNQFEADRDNCYKNKGNVNCFKNLMSKYYYANPAYINILHSDCAIILANEKRYQESLLEFDYILQHEKKNTKLIAYAKKEREKIAEIVRKIEDAKKNDYGDYYDRYNSAVWENPQDIKVYINNNYTKSYGKSYTYRNAFDIWEKSLNGLIHFNFVSNEQDADIVCDIVDKVGPNKNGITYYGSLTDKDGKKYFQKVRMSLSHINDMGADNTNDIILTTALHEIGHALGIKYHSNSINDIMYYEVHTYRTNSLSNRDINTIKKIYGVNY